MTARKYVPEPTRPLEMSESHWRIIAALPDTPTRKHPLGLRTAVIERASIIHEATGLDWSACDERALAEEAGVSSQQKLVGT